MFCLSAWSCTRRAASGLMVARQAGGVALHGVGNQQVGELVGDERAAGLQRRRIAEADLDRLAVAVDAGVADVLLAQQRAQVAGEGLGLLGQRRLHVHLQHEVHAAAQVQAQVHGRGVAAPPASAGVRDSRFSATT